MKARKFMTIWAAFSLLLAGWTSCVDDTSSLGGGNAPEIIITGMDPEKAVEVNSYTGVNLKDVIKPQVSANIPEERLSYAWYLFSTADAEGNYRDFLVSSEKEPDYEINLKTGSYEVVFEVTSQADGYTQVATATLNASTTFSRGFYILKETSGGATELDLYSSGLYMSDLMEQLLGAPLAGKPYNLCTYYNGEYINPDNNETEPANFVYVFTEDKVIRGFRAEDMLNVWDNGNLLYSGPMDADEQPSTFFRTMFCHAYVTGKGIYSIMSGGGWMPYSSGRYGYPTVSVSGSKFVQEAEGHGYILEGKADRIASSPSGGLVIYDYKKGSTFSSADLGDKSLQFYISRFLAERELHRHVERAAFVTIADCRISDADLSLGDDGMLSVLDEAADGMRNGRWIAIPDDGRCGRCGFRTICRRRFSVQ